MQLVAIVTLIGIALTVLVLAAYLITVALILKHVNFTLGTVIAGLRSIIPATEPLDEVVGEINKDLAGVRSALEALVEKAGQKAQ